MRSATRLWVPLEPPQHFGAVRGEVRRRLDLQASGLCSSSATTNLKMKEGRATLTPPVLAPAQQRPRCGGARQRRLLCVATATPRSRRSGAQRRRRWALLPLRRLKVFSQATATPPLRWHGVGSRLPLNMEPGADGHPGGSGPCRPAVSSTGDPPQRCSVLLQTGPRHLARGPLALAPRTSRRTTALLHASHRSICCASALVSIGNGDGRGRGPLPFKAKEFVSCHVSM